DLQLGMARAELAEQRREPLDAQRIWRGDPQPAPWAALQLRDRAFRLLELARDALAVLVVHVAGLGEPQLARGPVQELRTQAQLEVLHLAAHRGLGQAQRPGGCNEAAGFDHLEEDEGVVEVAVHRDSGLKLGLFRRREDLSRERRLINPLGRPYAALHRHTAPRAAGSSMKPVDSRRL